MNARLTRLAGLVCTVLYASFIVWLYARQPQTLSQVAGDVASTVGAYRVDDLDFAEGRRFFRNEQYPESRAAFARADPAQRDPRTQFYVAYSYYREGWGRLYHDDALYRQGIEAVDRAIGAAADGRVVIDGDPDLQMRSADELKAELERGLTRAPSDLNPLRVFNERK